MPTLALSGSFPVFGQSLVRVTGDDAEKFLHGQFTNSMTALSGKVRLAAYCSPKGRMLANFLAWRTADAFHLLMPESIVEGFVKRLRMYVLRAKVAINVVEPAPKLTVFLGRGGLAALQNLGAEAPAAGAVLESGCGTILGLSPMSEIPGLTDGTFRALLIDGSAQAEPAQADESGCSAWTAGQIAAGVAEVTAATKEAYVPQHVNFERAGGVIFTKGCYPGQEVVSRVEHIGKTNRRAAIGLLEDADAGLDACALAGRPVYAGGEECGTVVEAARMDGRLLVLLSATTDALENGDLGLSPEGPALARIALPYPLAEEA